MATILAATTDKHRRASHRRLKTVPPQLSYGELPARRCGLRRGWPLGGDEEAARCPVFEVVGHAAVMSGHHLGGLHPRILPEPPDHRSCTPVLSDR